MDKKKLLISFSGGKTSAYMTKWLLETKQEEYEMIVVFANTGKEREETLGFVKMVEDNFKIPVTWVEASVINKAGYGTSFTEVDYYSASRNGEPFQKVIAKYGIPNISSPHCTRELKRNTIRAYAKSIGWKGYYTAIGIRCDEIDRISKHWKRDKLIYPLILAEISKADINEFWENQRFTLKLLEHQGNCDCCFKKSFKKLTRLATEEPKYFEWWKQMEKEYGQFAPIQQKGRFRKIAEGGKIVFYRGNTSAKQILQGEIPKSARKLKHCTESCEPF